ncbi:IS1182 family transposase [Halomonas sediminis]
MPTPDDRQFSLFQVSPASSTPSSRVTATSSGRRFLHGDATAIFLGMTPLEEHLRQAGIRAPFVVADLLDAQDWTPFEDRYAATGRAPYAPRAMMGLILYGIMHGVSSLRALERLARVDLGCMWVTGGIAPDHANIGRFICLHEQALAQEFFEALTRTVLARTATSTACLAGDGTVIEAACSHYRLLREEAVRTRVSDALTRHQQTPLEQQDETRQQLDRAHACEQVLDARIAARRRHGKRTDTVRVSLTEPEAAMQRQKRGRGFAPAYTPSVLANEARIIVAHAVDPTSETRVVGELIDQSERVEPKTPRELLLDAGYFDDGVINATLARDVSLLCPPRPSTTDKAKGLYHKNLFTYDAEQDVYYCPAGQRLQLISHTRASARSREQSVYACVTCADCPQRIACTRSVRGRRIRRYPEDEARLALQQIMTHPGAQAVFRQRKAMVEPVFSALRQQQGLSRFRRRGLAGVKREFALHALAYNLARAVALSLYHRLWDRLWRCLGLSYLATKEMIAAARV